MEDFNIHIDYKVTAWERRKWSITAANEEEAKAKALEIFNNPDSYYEQDSYVGLEHLLDTTEYITPEDNGGQTTEEVYVNDELVHKNV